MKEIWHMYKSAKAGCPQKLSNRVRRELVREATKTPVNSLQEFQVCAAEMLSKYWLLNIG